ncbi:hypothetical protein OG738_03705 [Amycolatopsis sp. NBC_01488]|uniref:hypothetical protein n=1 Tax=Amycolatopsis sp. NBC_01488 TaxID=2903563 RepID=UPI002E2E7363|nr:hypothetical protein [Amycolatopsis sp. NBC_01488]
MEYEEVDHNGLHKHGDYLNLDPAEIEHLRLLASGDLYKAPEWVDSPALADDWKYDPDEGLDDDEPTPDYETGYWEVTPDTGIPGPLPPGLDAPSPDA